MIVNNDNYQTIDKELEVCHFERKCCELEIPGFPLYTIDSELRVRSYCFPGQPRILKIYKAHHGEKEYRLFGHDTYGLRKIYYFSPLRLYMCATFGFDPRNYKLEDIVSNKKSNGYDIVLNRLGEKVKGGTIITSSVYRKEMSDTEKQLTRVSIRMHELNIIKNAIETENWDDVWLECYSYKGIVERLMWYLYGIPRKNIEDFIELAIEKIMRDMMKNHIVVSSFMNTLLKQTRLFYTLRNK